MRLIDAEHFKKYRTELTDDMSPLERMYLIGRNDMVAIIESAPTVEYRWIPVTERLPENQEDVHIWFDRCGGDIDVGWFSLDKKAWFCKGIMLPYTVTHWMPLPEPPKKGE